MGSVVKADHIKCFGHKPQASRHKHFRACSADSCANKVSSNKQRNIPHTKKIPLPLLKQRAEPVLSFFLDTHLRIGLQSASTVHRKTTTA